MSVPSTALLADLRGKLDSLASGDLAVGEARSAVRSAIDAGDPLISEAYDALRGMTWHLVRAREQREDVEEWHDLHGNAAALARRRGRNDLADRIAALADVISQNRRFSERQPLTTVLARQHVATLLERLRAGDGAALRAELAKDTGLADANLSRILGILSAHGLIRRTRQGKNVRVELTESGAAAGSHSTIARHAGAAAVPWWNHIPDPTAVWASDGSPVGCNSAFREIMGSADCATPSALTRAEWEDWLSSMPRAGSRVDGPLQFGPKRWLRVDEAHFPDRSSCVRLLDLSAETQTITSLQHHLTARDLELVGLREALAKAEAAAEESRRSLLSFGAAFETARNALLDEAAPAIRGVKNWLRGASEPRRHDLEAADRYLTRTCRMLNLLAGPSASDETPTLQVVAPDALRDVVTSVSAAIGQAKLESHLHGHWKSVWVDTYALRTALLHSMLALMPRAEAGDCRVDAQVRNKSLIVTLRERSKSGRGVPRWFGKDWHGSGDDMLFAHGLSFCRDVVSRAKGEFRAGTDADGPFVQIVVPATRQGGGRKGPSAAHG